MVVAVVVMAALLVVVVVVVAVEGGALSALGHAVAEALVVVAQVSAAAWSRHACERGLARTSLAW